MGNKFPQDTKRIVKGVGGAKKPVVILVIFLIAMNIATLIFLVYKSRQDSAKQFENPYSMIDPARSFIAQEHFIINIQPLREDLIKIVDAEKSHTIGVYFEVLNTGANISLNKDVRFWPASLIKMPTALAVMKKIERGEWKLDNELVLFQEDRDERFGTLYRKPTGTRFTIEELLKELLIYSDDTAHRILFRNLAAEDIEELQNALGLDELYNENYDITAKEYSRIFRALYTSSFLKREYSQKILEWLSQTPFDEFLASAVPKDVVFPHKIGEHDKGKTYLDSGIVYVPNRPYLLTVMVKIGEGGDREKAKEIFKQISQKAYEYIKNY
jgi:beta-lactamase class A